MPILLIESGKSKGDLIVLPGAGSVVAGRLQECDLRVDDNRIGRRHFRVEVSRTASGASFTAEDLGSANGTLLGGKRMVAGQKVPLAIGDRIQLGDSVVALLPDEARETGADLTGRTIGGYRLEERLGQGSAGTVYRAVQLSLERTVAFKVLASDLSRDPRRVERFLEEARAAGKLQSPHVVQVFQVGTDAGHFFYSMELMARGSLETRLAEKGRIGAREALEAALGAARALEFAERAGVVHGDVRPSCLLASDEGTVKLSDLGIARADGQPARYPAPETASGAAPDARADLFALGATLHHLVAGEPFDPESAQRLDEIDGEVPPDFADLVLSLLAENPEDRPGSAAAVVEAVRLQIGQVGAHAESGASQRWMIVAAILILLAGAGLFVRQRMREKREAADAIARAEAEEAEETRRKAAQEAAVRERAEEAKRRAEEVATANDAVDDADRFLSEHPDDLDAALGRYRAVEEKHPGTPAAARAHEQVGKLEPLLADDAARRAAKEKRAADATQALDDIARSLDDAHPERFSGLRSKLDKLAPTLDGDAAARAAGIKKDILARIQRAQKAADDEARAALDAADYTAARAVIARVAAWKVAELAPWIEGWTGRIALAERQAQEALDQARRATIEEELAQVRKADDRDRLRDLRFADVRTSLEALSPHLTSDEAKERAGLRIDVLRAEEKAIAALVAHVNEKKKPELTLPLGGSLDGYATSADATGITFAAKGQAGVEVRRALASLGVVDLGRFLGLVGALPKDDAALALGAIAADLGDDDRSRKELSRAVREGRPEVKALAEKALAAGSGPK